ncbi:MAG: magnesium transporter [Chloroflexi bacterium]|nr:MAG: magnesium transporter [Chloroflexota bacterium]MBL1196088.1 magnesium transporter [Chloroflexota bacterium]NOH13381.1 magnesium transporter [Chloroflexota bacterium]
MTEFQVHEPIADRVRNAINKQQYDEAVALFLDLLPGDQVEVFNLLNSGEQETLLPHLDVEATAELFDRLTDAKTLEAAKNLPLERLADVLGEMEPDEAADLLGDLPQEQALQALEEMDDAEDVEQLLAYPDDTAGGRMTTAFIAMQRITPAQEAIEVLRHLKPDSEIPYYIFVIDREKRLSGIVGLRDLVVAAPQTSMEDIMNPEVINVNAELDQEEVAQVMTRHDLQALPVVNHRNELVGVITHDDILDVLAEEHTEDIYRLASVGDVQLEPESPVREHLRGRLPWLYLNTVTAMFAAWVISNFEDIIAQVAALAVFQSVVAGVGGNAGSQSIALIVRALALGKLSPRQAISVLGKEVFVGILQGVAIGIVVGLGVFLWRGNAYLGIVLGLALLGNMIIAGFAGALVPLLLRAIGQDPALASTVLVTAVTDSLGFLIFLGLASIFLNFLI